MHVCRLLLPRHLWQSPAQQRCWGAQEGWTQAPCLWPPLWSVAHPGAVNDASAVGWVWENLPLPRLLLASGLQGLGFPLPCRLCLLRHAINSPGVTGSSLPSRGAGLRFPDAVLSHNLWCQTRPLFSQEQKGRTKRYYEIKQQYSAGRLTSSYCLICSKVGRSWLLLASPIIWPHTTGLSSAAGMLQPSHCFTLMKKRWRRDCQDELSALYSPMTFFFFFFWNKAISSGKQAFKRTDQHSYFYVSYQTKHSSQLYFISFTKLCCVLFHLFPTSVPQIALLDLMILELSNL